MLAYPTKVTKINTEKISDETYNYDTGTYRYEQNLSASQIQIYENGAVSKLVVIKQDTTSTEKPTSYFESLKGYHIVNYKKSENNSQLFIFANPISPKGISISEQSVRNQYRISDNKLMYEYYQTFPTKMIMAYLNGDIELAGLARELEIGCGVASVNIEGLVDLQEINLNNAKDLTSITITNLFLSRLHIPNGIQACTIDTCLKIKDLWLPSTIRVFKDSAYIYADIPNYITSNITLDTSNYKNPQCESDKNIMCGEVLVHLGNPNGQNDIVKNTRVIITNGFRTIDYPVDKAQLEEGSSVDGNGDTFRWSAVLYQSYANRLEFDNIEFIGSNSFYCMPPAQMHDGNVSYSDSRLEVADFGNNENEVTIENNAFESWVDKMNTERYGLREVILPKYKKTFGTRIFAYTQIEHLDIPKTWKSIENYVFADMDRLTSVTIPSTIKSIGQGAFNNTALTEVTIAKDCVCGTNAFPNNCTIKYYE